MGGLWKYGVYKNTSLTNISVKASTPKKGHSENRCSLLNKWHLTMPKISTEPPSSPPELDTYTSIKILTDSYLRSFKSSGSIFKAHKTPYNLNTLYHQIEYKNISDIFFLEIDPKRCQYIPVTDWLKQ